jgi:hypothetical protein
MISHRFEAEKNWPQMNADERGLKKAFANGRSGTFEGCGRV